MTTIEIVLTLGAGALLAAAAVLAPARRRRAYGAVERRPAGGVRAADGGVGGVVGGARRELAGRRADARLQRRVRGLGGARAARAPALARGARRGHARGRRGVRRMPCSRRSSRPRSTPAQPPPACEEPYGYWNAVGLTAAMGAIGCMWLGARRSGHALLSAMSYPAMGLLLLTLLLAYSRGALVALAVGLLAWFCIVPLRLRGAAVLLCGGVAAAAVAGWSFSVHALSAEQVPLARTDAVRAPAGSVDPGDGAGAGDRGCRDRLPDRAAGALAAMAPARRHDARWRSSSWP